MAASFLKAFIKVLKTSMHVTILSMDLNYDYINKTNDTSFNHNVL